MNYPEFELVVDVSSAQWFNLVNPNLTKWREKDGKHNNELIKIVVKYSEK